MAKKKSADRFDPESIAEEFREEFERRCSPDVCSKEEWMYALEALLWRLQDALACVKSELLEEDD